MRIKDTSGRIFGKWTVLNFEEVRNKSSYWRCLCECGTEKIISRNSLISGTSKSCGCTAKNILITRQTTHGKRSSKAYSKWSSMITRCTNPNYKGKHRYMDRGITVSEDWLTFENFYRDMGDPPKDYTLDRINNDKGYYHGNCRWATTKEQSYNTSKNIYLTYNNKTQCLAQWAKEFSIPYNTLLTRIKRQKWSTEKALTQKIRTKKNNYI